MRLKLFCISLFVLFLSVSSVHAGTISKPPYSLSLNSGLVGHWTFDGANITNGRINDISGQGNHGNPSGISTSTFYTAGKVGQGGNFDGVDDEVLIQPSSSINNLSSITISVWIKPQSFASCTNYNASVVEKQNTNHGWHLACNSSGYFRFVSYNGDSGGTNMIVNTAAPLSLNVWTNLVFTWDGNVNGANAKLYVSGVESTTLAQVGTGTRNNDATLPIHIGRSQYDTGYYKGIIDDVRIYNRAISTSEITSLYSFGASKLGVTKTPTGLKSGLVGHWTFDGKNMTNGRVDDISGQGNHGNTSGISTSTFYTVGKMGQGAQFDGVDDSVAGNNVEILNPSNPNTICMWAKSADINAMSGGFTQHLLNHGYNTGNGLRIIINTGGSLHVSYQVGGVTYSKESTTQVFFNNTWVHVCETFDGASTLALYANGSALSTTGSASVNFSTNFFTLGKRSSQGYFTGTLDDLRIYSRALTASEILQLYNAGAPKTNVTLAPTGLKSGLVGHWTFDGKNMTNGRVDDISGQGNHGNTSGISTSTFYTVGKMGQGAQFDGVDDNITLPLAASLAPSSITVSTWIKTNSSATQDIIAKANVNNSHHSWELSLNSSGKAILGINTSSGSNPDYTITSNASISLNAWTLITATYSSSGPMAVYINGVLDNSATVAGGTIRATASIPTYIGTKLGSPSFVNYFSGNIDDVRIYDRVLTASEILQLYNAGR
jgi:hypothetical protein